MANLCDYEMMIVGNKEAIKRVLKCLKTEYHYLTGTKPKHKHFFRISEVWDDDIEENEDEYSVYIHGTCDWSVSCCMCSGEHSCYAQTKESHPDIFMGTTLEEQSKDCAIEVFSEETGNCFSEHFLYENGKCLIEDYVDLQRVEDKNGNVTYINPHKETNEDLYRWII